MHYFLVFDLPADPTQQPVFVHALCEGDAKEQVAQELYGVKTPMYTDRMVTIRFTPEQADLVPWEQA